jgi:ABC-2 type transport system permease protein
MRSMKIAGRVIRQIIKDRRTLALLFVAPLLVIFLLQVVLTAKVTEPQLLTVGLPDELQTEISAEADVAKATDLSDALEVLKKRETDAVVVYNKPDITVYVEGTETSVTTSVKKAVGAAAGRYSKEAAAEEAQKKIQEQEEKVKEQVRKQFTQFRKKIKMNTTPDLELNLPDSDFSVTTAEVQYSYLCGSDDMTVFDSTAPLMMGFFVFFFVFLLAGVAFLRERISGTLERLLAAPVRRRDIVLGYFFGFGVFAFLQTLLIEFFMVKILNVEFKGSFLLVLLTNLLLASGSLALGTLLSAYARNELQLFQFIPIVIVPQILFCGLFCLRGAPAWTAVLAKICPLTYAADALQNIVIRGLGFSAVWQDLLVLLGCTVLFLFLNTLVLKKYRKI